MFDRVRAAFDKALGYLPLTMLRGLKNPQSPSTAYLLEEKVRETVQGPGIRVRFLPLNDGYTQETSEMRAQYRIMLRDPYIKQALLTKILGVASLDLQVHAVSKSPYDKQVADFCKWAVEKSKGGLRKLVFDTLFPAMIEGYSISEKLWMIEDYGQYAGKIRLKGIKSKDIKHLEMMGDDFRNVTGIRDLRGWAPTGYQGYHPDNFVMYSHLSLFESPTGMSDFRAIYRAYWLVDTAWQLRAIGLERFGLPMMVGKYSHDDQKQALDNALSLMRSQSWLSIPETAKVEAMELAARGTADFQAAIKDLREEVVIGIAGAMLHMMQGDAGAGARGNSKVQKSTTELQQWMLSAQMGDIITDQIFPDLVSFNYPGAEVPSATLGSVSDDEMAASLDVDKFFLTVARQPLSREATYKAYNRQEPMSPEDAIMPPPLPPSQGGGGGPAPSPSSITVPTHDSGPPGADPGTNITDVPPVTPDAGPEAMADHGSDPNFFCGGKGGTPGPCPTKSGTGSSKSILTKAVDKSKAIIGGVKAGVDAIKAKLDAKTNGPVLSQVKAVFGVAKAAMDKVNAKLEERYGKAGARAIFWGGQALGANPLVAPAWFITLPGATFLAQLPLAAGAEAILQTSRGVKAAKSAMGFAESVPSEPTDAQRQEYLSDLYSEFYAALEPLKGKLAETLAPLADVDKFADDKSASLANFPDHRQKDDYDCGAAAYGAVLAHHGQFVSEADLVKALGTTKTNGTKPPSIIAHARDSGLSVSARPNMTLADLRGHLDAGRPVICPIQDGEPSKESNGHYVAAIGYGPNTIHVHDPAKGRVTWPNVKFDSHWHDRDANGVGYTRFGIAIGKGKPKAEPELQAADSPADNAKPLPPDGKDVAGPHKDAAKVQSLLTAAQKNGVRVLSNIGKQAVARMFKNGPSRTTRLFTDGERKELADAIAATNATANLLGRAKLYIRKEDAEKAHKKGHKFADHASETDFSRFDEPKYIKPMAPAKALSYFKSLVPSMEPPANFPAAQYADAFRLAVDADATVLGKVKDVIANRIESGKGIRSAPAEIDEILEEAGISSTNPDYGCFLPGTLVEGDVLAVSRAKYSGPAVEIETDDGRRLRVTINHPILTAVGWKHAGDIQEGENLVCYGKPVKSLRAFRFNGLRTEFSDAISDNSHSVTSFASIRTPSDGRAINNQNVPARIEDVFQSVFEQSASRSNCQRPISTLNFHGDAAFMDGKIDRVLVDRELMERGNTDVFKFGEQVKFMLRNISATQSASHGCGLLDSFTKSTFNADSALLRNNKRTLQSFAFGRWTKIAPVQSHRIGLASMLHPSRFHATYKRAGGDVQLYRKLIVSLPGLITTNRVIKIKRIEWMGHVYDLQTRTGFIVSDGIVTSNSMVFRTNTMQAYNKGSQDAFDDPDVADFFPVWQYMGIKDGRQGADHAPHFDKYYSRRKTFAEIRGDRVFNCRCVPSFIPRPEWLALEQSGATVEE